MILMPNTTGRHAPAVRLSEARAILNSGEGASVYDLAERLDVSVKTARRYLAALERAGEPLYEERDGKRKVWRLLPSARTDTLRLSTSQMLSLFLSRRVFDFLEGTGFAEDLDDVFHQLRVSLKRQDALVARHLDRKIFDVNEAPRIYADRVEDVGELLTGLIREERLRITHVSQRGHRARQRLVDPYTLLVYKKGLYLVGYSHHHSELRTFSFDAIRAVDWLRGEHFDYPEEYHPSQLIEGAFGLIAGAPVAVRIRFTAEVARLVQRSRWHPSQRIRKVRGGGGALELRLEVAPTVELVSWILGFGRHAEVLAPDSLRETIAEEIRAMATVYGAA